MSVAGKMENTEIYEFLKIDQFYPISSLKLTNKIESWENIT
jgi:hypothetical protein